jgi:hypothetical protein
MMNPHLIGAFAAERQARMLASAEVIRLARQAGGGRRRAHSKTVLGRWTRRFALWRIRPLPVAQAQLRQGAPAGRATGAAPTT